jgi:hypothetical protein
MIDSKFQIWLISGVVTSQNWKATITWSIEQHNIEKTTTTTWSIEQHNIEKQQQQQQRGVLNNITLKKQEDGVLDNITWGSTKCHHMGPNIVMG